MTNITVANFTGGSHVTRTSAVYQYDYGQILQFSGLDLPTAYEVHFSNQEMLGTAKTSIGNEDGVVIPDEYLLSGERIYAWIFLHVGDTDGETEYKITIPVNKRAQPTAEEPTPVQQDVITQTIAELNSAVEKVSQAVANSPKIENGTWHVWDADDSVWVDTGVKAEGIDGTDGVDGISPIISTEPVENGHRITFTDKDGTHVITLTNGAKGDTGDPGPRGEVGPTGATGVAGRDGVSPTFQAKQITGGYQLTITDAKGTHTVDLMDGAQGPKGETGDSGPKGDTGLQGPKGDTGATGQTGPQGPKGDDGDDGYTPVKGTDYWTAQDQQDIIDEVVDILEVKTQTVSGTDVSINGAANTRYICGEVSTINITPPASGIIDVIFSSGSTVAVLTLPQTVKMPYWFEVETNKTYEISILDGVYGVVASWT